MIRNEEDLANTLGMAFARYANQVQNRAIEPYKAFLDGATTVDVTVTLNHDGSIRVEENTEAIIREAEIKNLKRKNAEQKKEIESLNILLEEQKPKEELKREWIDDEQIGEAKGVIIETEKPKKRKSRRKKK